MPKDESAKICKRCILNEQKRQGREAVPHTCSQAQMSLPGTETHGPPPNWWRSYGK